MSKDNETNPWPFDQPRNCASITSRQIMSGSEPILWVSHDDDDAGWQFIGESGASSEDALVVSLESVILLDPTLLEIADLPLGWVANRSEVGALWERSPNVNEEEDLIITPIPSLVATLLNREQAKGAPLTREEVEEIRDQAPSVALTAMQKAAIDENRGYQDIDPDQAWEAWQVVRLDFETSDH